MNDKKLLLIRVCGFWCVRWVLITVVPRDRSSVVGSPRSPSICRERLWKCAVSDSATRCNRLILFLGGRVENLLQLNSAKWSHSRLRAEKIEETDNEIDIQRRRRPHHHRHHCSALRIQVCSRSLEDGVAIRLEGFHSWGLISDPHSMVSPSFWADAFHVPGMDGSHTI